MPDNQQIGFWERIARSGAATMTSLAIITVGIIMIFLAIDFTKEFTVAWWAALAFLFGKGLVTSLRQ